MFGVAMCLLVSLTCLCWTSTTLRGRMLPQLSPLRICCCMGIPWIRLSLAWYSNDIQKHLKLGAVKLVRKQDVPKGTRIIGVRFTDFDKFEGEECIKQKSRVAAKGFMQRKRIDCGDVVIPTPDELAIRTIFTLTTLQRVFLEAGDDESAFLKAKRNTPVYLRMPVDYIPKDHSFEAWAGLMACVTLGTFIIHVVYRPFMPVLG
eukprot:g32618.t1